MNNLDHLIDDAEQSIRYHEERLAFYKLQLDAYYTARDAKCDNPYSNEK